VDGGACTLLHSPNGPFDFTNMVVGGGDIEPGREDVVSDALKFHVGVQVGDVETLDLYIAITGLISRRRVVLFLLSTGATVRN